MAAVIAELDGIIFVYHGEPIAEYGRCVNGVCAIVGWRRTANSEVCFLRIMQQY